jgi:hypothetical protein
MDDRQFVLSAADFSRFLDQAARERDALIDERDKLLAMINDTNRAFSDQAREIKRLQDDVWRLKHG